MSSHLLRHFTKVAVGILLTATFVACYDRTSFFNYHAINLDGWDRTDFQEYQVNAISEEGYYMEEIGVRTTKAYPYQQLHLIVKQEIISTTGTHPNRFRRDTLHIDIYDSWGKPKGKGIDLFQNVVPFKTLPLKAGDSISLQIAHDMKALSIKGISDVGLKVTHR